MKEDILAMYLAAVNPLGRDVWTWLTKVEILGVGKLSSFCQSCFK